MQHSFKRARIILTLWYTAFCMVLIVLMNIGVMNGIGRSIAPSGTPSQALISIGNNKADTTTTSLDEINKRFGKILVVVDGVLIALSAFFGYTLSGITLRPIQKNMKEQEEFAQEASHELRTPLSVASMEIETIKRTEKRIPSTYAAAFKNIEEELKRMGALVDGLLSLVYPSESYTNLHKPFNITTSAKQAFLQLQKIATEKHLSYTFSSTYDGTIYGNDEEIRQVVLILLDNAIKYSREKDSVALTIEEVADDVLIKVSDTGMGIDERDLPHIFDRFYRAGTKAPSDMAEGLGLGLAIAQKKVKLHKGKLLIQSKPGHGTTVSAYLPKRSK